MGGGTAVLAAAIAAQSGSLIPAAEDGNPVYPLITWMDGRTQHLVQQWQEEGLGAQVKRISGWSLPLPTIAGLRQHDPAAFAAARRYLSVNDFIAHRLTGKFAANPSNGGGMQLVDIRTGKWSAELCALAGIAPQQLSPILRAAAVIGPILPDAARALGLPEGVLLVNGGHDQGCTALGLGIAAPGKLLLACGTAWVITAVMDTPDLARAPAVLDWNAHVVDGRYTLSQSLGGLGASLEWWLNQAWGGACGQASRKAMFAALDAELAKTEVDGRLFFIPPTGGHNNPATTQRGGFTGLQLRHSRADMARAIMESAAFELRWALQTIRQAGLPVERLWMVGGAAQSRHWPQILADVTGVPIRLPDYDNWPALGTAVLAGVGIGAFADVAEALSPARDVAPDTGMQGRYGGMFDRYKQHIAKLPLVKKNSHEIL